MIYYNPNAMFSYTLSQNPHPYIIDLMWFTLTQCNFSTLPYVNAQSQKLIRMKFVAPTTNIHYFYLSSHLDLHTDEYFQTNMKSYLQF